MVLERVGFRGLNVGMDEVSFGGEAGGDEVDEFADCGGGEGGEVSVAVSDCCRGWWVGLVYFSRHCSESRFPALAIAPGSAATLSMIPSSTRLIWAFDSDSGSPSASRSSWSASGHGTVAGLSR